MIHVAIMIKSWQMIPKIISGEKTIESRWYKTKCEAFGRVNAGDTVYFKNSGEPVSLKTGVVRVLEFSDLNQKKIKKLQPTTRPDTHLLHTFYPKWIRFTGFLLLPGE